MAGGTRESLISSVRCKACRKLAWTKDQLPVRILDARDELHHPECPVVQSYRAGGITGKVATRAGMVGGMVGGAAVGMMVGGPIGAAVGALIGGALGRNA